LRGRTGEMFVPLRRFVTGGSFTLNLSTNDLQADHLSR
jgi:hypothetical protein